MRISLRVMAGPNEGQVFTFDCHDTFIVGRSRRAHFRLPPRDQYFSRVHFMVELNPPRCRLLDLNSTNGTYVNDRAVAGIDLQDGDQIRAGKTILQVSFEKSEEDSAAVPPVVSELESAQGPAPASNGQATPCPSSAAPPTKGQASHSMPVIGSLSCRVCDAAMSMPGSSPTQAVPLCAACREQIQKQPQPIAGYKITRETGRGSMGVIYQALRVADGSLVALKTIRPALAASQTEVERFLREARILRQLDHPHIVAFREMGESNGLLYFAMDYVKGTDARALLQSHGPLPIARAVGLVCQLLEGLEYAHGRQFVHRDIKPGNMLLTEVNGREVVKLADFGLARVYQVSTLSGLTLMDDIGGTVAYVAPEQLTRFREAKPPADQYAAAATLYNLLTDRLVFDLPRNVKQQLVMILEENPVPIRSRRPEIPDELAKVIHRSLAKEPKKRFPDVGAMRKALLKFCQ